MAIYLTSYIQCGNGTDNVRHSIPQNIFLVLNAANGRALTQAQQTLTKSQLNHRLRL